MRLLSGVAALALAVLPSACALFAVKQPARIENWDDLDERELAFESGRTRFSEAVEALRERGLTGIRHDTYVAADARAISAVSADYQSRIHVFENERYKSSTVVPASNRLPYDVALHAVQSGGGLLLLAVQRDALELAKEASSAEPPAMSVFAERGGGFEFVKAVSLGALSAEHGGLTDPIIVGRDLDEGVMFLGRDRSGVVWSSAYLVTMREGELALAPLPLEEAAKCSCIHDYVYGASE